MRTPHQRERRRAVRLVAAAMLTVALAVALATAACTASRPTEGPSPRTTSRADSGSGARRAVAAQYLQIAEEGNRRLEIDFDGLEQDDGGDLAAARADLLDAAATERLFDRRLLAITFPPALEQVVRTLYTVNQSRAALTIRAAGATSLAQLREYETRLDAANVPVERQVRIIRRQLGLPPPETS